MNKNEKLQQDWETYNEHFKKHESKGTKEDSLEHKGSWESVRFDDDDKEGNDSWE